MAKEVVQQRGIAIRLACQVFSVSESCYRYESRQNAENDEIASWLLRLTDSDRNWGFGLCYLYLRNVKNFGWNHKRIYRIYRELELNLRIKPRRRLVREKPEPLAVYHRPSTKSGQWTSCTTACKTAETSGCSMSSMTSTVRLWAFRLTSRCRPSGSSGLSSRSSPGVANPRQSVVTTVRKTSAPRFRNGPKSGTSGLNTSSPTSRSRMLLSRGSTEQFATSGCHSITGQALKKFRTSPRSGCGPTITTAPEWPWAVSPQSSTWPRLHNVSTSESSGNRGDYRVLDGRCH